MYKKIGFAGKGLAILCIGAVLGVILLSLAFMVPVGLENQQKSYEIMEQEGWYPAMPVLSKSLDTHFHSFLPGVLDNGTDLLMLQTALETHYVNPLYASMDMRGYSYYWHGYVAILRPLLSLFDYGEIRVLNSIGQILLIFVLMNMLWKKRGIRYALILFTSYIFLMPLAMQMSLQFSWVFYITYGGLLFALKKQQWLECKGRMEFMFIILGMLTSFLDLLTYPLYTWAIPMIWLLVVGDEGKKVFFYLKKVVVTGLCWIVGYAGMWVSKWTIGSFILKENIFEKAFYEVFFRVGMGEGKQDGMLQRLEALYSNWKHYEYKLYIILLAIWLVWLICTSIRKGWKDNKKAPALLLIAFSPVVWYFVLSNHTLGHHFFTYRIWNICVTALLAFFMLKIGTNEIKKSVQQLIMRGIIWGGIGVCSVGLSFLARENVTVINGSAVFKDVNFSEGDTFEVSFTPTFSHVTEWGIGMRSKSEGGNCIFSLYDGEKMLYEERIALSEFRENVYKNILVNWKLEAGKDYQIYARLEQSRGDTAVLVTEQLQMPLNEYGEVYVNKKGTEGQPLAGIVYRHRPLSRKTLLFLTISWMGVLAGVLLGIKQIIGIFHCFYSEKKSFTA